MKNSDAQCVWVIMGPTASGKTDLAVWLAQRFAVDIISVDSALVYRDMDIGTAKPSSELRARFPHRLVDIRDPAQAYSAAEFREDALREIEASHRAGRIPLLVGGTMLYFRTLFQGIAALPSADSALREELEAQAARLGWAHMHAELAQVDPQAAARIHPNDPQRIQRALEVYRLTGQPLSALYAQQTEDAFPYSRRTVVLEPSDRAALHWRIAERFDVMLAQGVVAEVQRLRARGDLHGDLPSLRAVGYRQIWDFLAGHCSAEQMRERAIFATRQLAKRQLTWLRRDWGAQHLYFDEPGLHERVLRCLHGAST